MIDFYLICLENGKSMYLTGLATSEDGKRFEFGGSRKICPERYFTKDQVKDAVIQFLMRHSGKAIAFIPANDVDHIDGVIDYYDEKHNEELSFGEENMMSFEDLLNLEGDLDTAFVPSKEGVISPMVIDCIDKAVSRFDWTSTMDAIFSRQNDEKRREFHKSQLKFFQEPPLQK